MRQCYLCKESPRSEEEDPTGEHDLRPYGPQGQDICYLCAVQPERKAQVEAQMEAHMAAAFAASPVVAITAKDGFVPLGGKRQ